MKFRIKAWPENKKRVGDVAALPSCKRSPRIKLKRAKGIKRNPSKGRAFEKRSRLAR